MLCKGVDCQVKISGKVLLKVYTDCTVKNWVGDFDLHPNIIPPHQV